MQLFISSGPFEKTCFLNPDESRHAIKVLRLRRGDTIWITNGEGILAKGIIIDPNPERCLVEICEQKPVADNRGYHLQIAISLLKNHERFEWFVEKAVEIGIDVITPLICDHSEKINFKPERINRIVVSAMKQSLKTVTPIINKPISFIDFIDLPEKGDKLIAHCNDTVKVKLSEFCLRGKNYLIAIGPEGDFSIAEIERAISTGYMPISLGTSRLRTETAGIAACHSLYFLNL